MTTGDGDFDQPRGTGVFSVVERLDAPPPVDPARIIAGRYEIVERIGEGAMGQVVHVRHMRLAKEFALKLMHADLVMDPDARERFVSEARLASMLSHPNIVSIVDFGDDPDWGLFIAMELVKGERLSERILGTDRLPVDVVCHVAWQLARALQHSHGTGVVHGDLKAENVLCVSPFADGADPWHVKLLDFGTARVALPGTGREERVAGTPAYLAPERILGNPPAPANDLYSLGVLLYEMLAGSTPFLYDSPVAVLQAHVHEQPEPVGARRGEVLDDALVAIVDRCLAKSPAERYPSAQALADDVGAYLEAHGIREQALAQRTGQAAFTREQAAADALDALAAPVAGLDVDGTIRVANRSFAALLGMPTAQAAEGCNLVGTRLGSLHPQIREDLRLVAMHGKLVRRHLRLPLAGGGEQVVLLIMSPSTGGCGPCLITLDSLLAT